MIRSAVIIALSLITSPVFADSIRKTATGCRNLEDAQIVTSIVKDEDMPAFLKFLGKKASGGNCIKLDKGSNVSVIRRTVGGDGENYTLVRTPGSADSHWIGTEYLD